MSVRRQSYLLIAPAALIYAALFVAATVYFFVMSFWTVKLLRFICGLPA